MKIVAVGALILCLGLMGCEGRNTIQLSMDQARLAFMEEQIDRLIADLRCADGSACRVIPLGVKACGGPVAYKLYSVENVDTLQLQKAVTEYDEFNAEMNRRYGATSDCSLVGPPSFECHDGQCQVVGPGR